MQSTLYFGDAIDGLATLPTDWAGSIVCDPDYGIASDHGRSGRDNGGWAGWETPYSPAEFQEFAERWGAEALRVVRPGAWLAGFGSPRTIHRMATGLENVGWDVKDMIPWVHNNGTMMGSTRTNGWAQKLRPVHEPILLCKAPYTGTLKDTHAQHGTGLLNVDACLGDNGKWPNNLQVCPKAKGEAPVIEGAKHTTVKPLHMVRWLVRLITPPGSTVLDPFAGSGTTLEAAQLEGFDSWGAERDPGFVPLIRARMERQGVRLVESSRAPTAWDATWAAPDPTSLVRVD